MSQAGSRTRELNLNLSSHSGMWLSVHWWACEACIESIELNDTIIRQTLIAFYEHLNVTLNDSLILCSIYTQHSDDDSEWHKYFALIQVRTPFNCWNSVICDYDDDDDDDVERDVESCECSNSGKAEEEKCSKLHHSTQKSARSIVFRREKANYFQNT